MTFASGSATLTPRGRAVVGRMAELLAGEPGTRLRIEGHTDDSGTARVNRELSAARARTVRLTLQYRGIERSRLSSLGRGEARPLVPNTSEANRAANRRVEVTVLPG
jgi:outer membrane protein OmpA-like peptidoglycan-associated protein